MFTHRPSRIPLAPEALGSRGSANPHSKPPACRLGSRGSEKELAQGRTAHRGRAGVGHGLAACRRGLALCLLGAESRAVDLPGTEDAVGSWPAGPQALSIAPRECRSILFVFRNFTCNNVGSIEKETPRCFSCYNSVMDLE